MHLRGEETRAASPRGCPCPALVGQSPNQEGQAHQLVLPFPPGPGGAALGWALGSSHGFDWGLTPGHVPCAPSHVALPVRSASALCCGRSGPVHVAHRNGRPQRHHLQSFHWQNPGRAELPLTLVPVTCHLSQLKTKCSPADACTAHPREGGGRKAAHTLFAETLRQGAGAAAGFCLSA